MTHGRTDRSGARATAAGPGPAQAPKRTAGTGGSPAETAGARAGLAMAGGLLMAMAAGLAALVAVHPGHPPTLGMDLRWLAIVRHTRDPFLTAAAKVTSAVGGPAGGTVIVVAAAAFGWFARGRRLGAAFLVATLAVTSGLSQLVKHAVLRPRPPGALVRADIGSFPSGHVITALAAGLALSLVLGRPGRRRLPLALTGLATLVMVWCRTYLGAHWLSDTIESMFVSGGVVLLGWAFAGRFVEGEAAGASRGPRAGACRGPREGRDVAAGQDMAGQDAAAGPVQDAPSPALVSGDREYLDVERPAD